MDNRRLLVVIEVYLIMNNLPLKQLQTFQIN